MDTDRIFVWFVYASLAAAVVLMVVTVLPSDGPTDTGPEDGVEPGDVEDTDREPDDTGDGPDGAVDAEGDESGAGAGDGDDGGQQEDTGGAGDDVAMQNESADPVRLSAGANDTTTANGTENGSYEPADVEAVESAVIRRINERRADAFVASLESIYLESLWAIAERHTADMVERDYVGIENPDGEGTFRRFIDVEPNCKRVDNYHRAFEGVARLPYSPWTNSSSYRTEEQLAGALVANYTDGDELTNDRYDDIGVDVRFDEPDGYVVSTVALC